MTLWQLIQKGGWVMYPLIVGSLFTWTLFIEKIIHYHLLLSNIRKARRLIPAQISSGHVHEAKGIASSLFSPIALLLAMIFLADSGGQNRSLSTKVARAHQETVMNWRRGLWILGSLGALSPFIGLLGTVLGVINSFEAIGKSGQGGFAVVSTGLSEALVATAAGIVVAVIAVAIYNYLLVLLQRVSMELKICLEEISESLEQTER